MVICCVFKVVCMEVFVIVCSDLCVCGGLFGCLIGWGNGGCGCGCGSVDVGCGCNWLVLVFFY